MGVPQRHIEKKWRKSVSSCPSPFVHAVWHWLPRQCWRRLTLITILSTSKQNGPQPPPSHYVWKRITKWWYDPLVYCNFTNSCAVLFSVFSVVNDFTEIKKTLHINTWSDYGRIYGYRNLNSAKRSVIPRYRNFNAPKSCTTTMWP